jgi:GNAT superfamily N-acetyltransferase
VALARPAAPGDLDRCVELLEAARREAGDARGAALAEGLRERPASVADWASGGDRRALLVGEFDGATVGIAAGRLADGPHGGGGGERRLGVVDFCYVEEAAREVGVGEALLDALLVWFSERGCTDIDAPVLPGDRLTKQLYERAGFKARLLTLHRRSG